MGLDVGDRLQSGARKLKYVVNGPLPGDHAFPSFRDFEVRSLEVLHCLHLMYFIISID